MLKVLHGADFHLDSPFSGLKPDAAARRRGEQRELLARLTDLAREREADLVLLTSRKTPFPQNILFYRRFSTSRHAPCLWKV